MVSATTQSVVTKFKLIVNTVLLVDWTQLKTAVERVVQCAYWKKIMVREIITIGISISIGIGNTFEADISIEYW